MKKMSPGVYGIYNVVTKQMYIGSSKSMARRMSTHRYMLKNKTHDNKKIKNDCALYGSESFIWGVIEECAVDMLTAREKYYIDKHQPSYNKFDPTISRSGYNHDDETIEKLKKPRNWRNKEARSIKLKDAWKKRREKPEYKEFIEQARQRRLGIKASKETKELMSKRQKGKKMPESFIEKTRKRRLGTKLVNGHYVKV